MFRPIVLDLFKRGTRYILSKKELGEYCLLLLRSDQLLSHRRVAALCVPALLRRAHGVLANYVADEALRASIPFARLVTV